MDRSLNDSTALSDGLPGDSELGYSIRQFFQNGGSRAYVVRLAKNPLAASLTLQNDAAEDVLQLTARDQGLASSYSCRTNHHEMPSIVSAAFGCASMYALTRSASATVSGSIPRDTATTFTLVRLTLH